MILFFLSGRDLGAGVPDGEVPEAEAGNREAVQETGEKERGAGRDQCHGPQ